MCSKETKTYYLWNHIVKEICSCNDVEKFFNSNNCIAHACCGGCIMAGCIIYSSVYVSMGIVITPFTGVYDSVIYCKQSPQKQTMKD